MFFDECKTEAKKLSLKSLSAFGTPEYFHERNTIDIDSIHRTSLKLRRTSSEIRISPVPGVEETSKMVFKNGLQSSHLETQTNQGIHVYRNEGEANFISPHSSPVSTFSKKSECSTVTTSGNSTSKCEESIETVSEQVDCFDDDRYSTSVVNELAKRTVAMKLKESKLPSLTHDLMKPNFVTRPEVEGRDVILIRNGRKSYGCGKSKQEVLTGIDMTVKEGTIYGLLGASGCGKTTLLSCLVGLRRLDSTNGGQLFVFGGRPGDPRIGIPGKRVGYMPQELALYGEFSISETLSYFGRLYGMEPTEVALRGKFLIDLLDLPPDSTRLVRNLSGGQQRRVSFAASLLHNPELLILDEPTVGVDPLLRKNIWSYLSTLSTDTKKTTIIITTHYIEEARHATTVGLMRNGKLLAEDSPSRLLDIHGLSSLEEVFLQLCVEDQGGNDQSATTLQVPNSSNFYSSSFDNGGLFPSISSSNTFATLPRLMKKNKRVSPRFKNVVYPGATAGSLDDLSIQGLSYIRYPVEKMPSRKINFQEANAIRYRRQMEQKKKSKTLKNSVRESWSLEPSSGLCSRSSTYGSCFSINRMFALIGKNFIKLLRNPITLLFMFMLPAIQVIFFCLAIGRQPTGLVLAVVNDEISLTKVGSGGSNQNLTWPEGGIVNSSFFEHFCVPAKGCEFSNLSCRFLKQLTNTSHENALLLAAYSNISEATEAVKDGKTWGVISMTSNFSDAFLDRAFNGLETSPSTRNESKINIHLDTTNQQINFVLGRLLADGYAKFLEQILSDCDYDKDVARTPLDFGTPIYGSSDPSFTDFMAPGIILLIVYFLAVALTGEAFISEKRDGLLQRSMVAGVSGYEIMAAQVITQFLVMVGQTGTTLLFTLVVFAIPCNGPVGWVVVIALLQGTAGMCFGFLISILCSAESTAMQISIGSFYPILLLSGILWPVEGMPTYLQAASWYLPCTWACQAMRDIMARGWGVEERFSVQMGLISSIAWIGIFVLASLVSLKIQQRSA